MSLECSRLQARTLRSRRTSSRNRLAVSKFYSAWAIIFALSSPAISAGATVPVRLPSPPDALCSAVMGCGCCVSQSSSAPACMCEAMCRPGISARSSAQPSPQFAKLDEACAALCAASCSELTAASETAEANLRFPIADATLQLALVFTVGPTNTSRCIQGSEPIRSESACKAAAFAMGLPFEDVIEAGPSGCHMTEDGVFFNPLDQGGPHCPVVAVICLPPMQHAQ